MLEVAQALELVLHEARPKGPVSQPLTGALGLTLAEEIAADRDSPPWDKSMVDGFAVRAADCASPEADLRVIEDVMAGGVPTKPVRAGEATRIMTGAPLPDGADAIVMVETTTVRTEGATERVLLRDAVKLGQNILRQGSAMRAGHVILRPGATIRSAEIGMLAEVGRAQVSAIPTPSVAVLSTGNELVGVDEAPGPGQIRNSNGPMLLAAARELGCEAIDLGIARDDENSLRSGIQRGLAADVLVLSGGVSAGVLDLAPRVFAESGIEQVFHKVRLKPGKPLWFGVWKGEERRALVFGLPGNPVSSHVCFQLFVRSAIGKIAGKSSDSRTALRVRLTTAFRHRGDRPSYHPAILRASDTCFEAEPVRWQGSADLYGLSQANGLLCFHAGDREYSPGDSIEALFL